MTWTRKMELNHTSERAIRKALRKIDRFTGSRRRESSSERASANKLILMDISLKSGEGGADGDGQLRSDMVHFHGLLSGECELQEAGGVPGFAVDEQFRVE